MPPRSELLGRRVTRLVDRGRRAVLARAPELDPDHPFVRQLAEHPEVLDVIADHAQEGTE